MILPDCQSFLSAPPLLHCRLCARPSFPRFLRLFFVHLQQALWSARKVCTASKVSTGIPICRTSIQSDSFHKQSLPYPVLVSGLVSISTFAQPRVMRASSLRVCRLLLQCFCSSPCYWRAGRRPPVRPSPRSCSSRPPPTSARPKSRAGWRGWTPGRLTQGNSSFHPSFS